MNRLILEYSEPAECESLGRNGYMATHGLRIDNLEETNSVVLRPINSRHQIGRALVSIHRNVAGDLSVYLAEIHGKHMSADDKRSFIERIVAAIEQESLQDSAKCGGR